MFLVELVCLAVYLHFQLKEFEADCEDGMLVPLIFHWIKDFNFEINIADY